MASQRRKSQSALLIEGDFAPVENTAILKNACGILGASLVLALVVSLGIYGVTVHLESGINDVVRRARSVKEVNKELSVQLNRIQAYKNVEAAAVRLPQLHLSEEVIEVSSQPTGQKGATPQRSPVLPAVYGY